MGGYRGAAIGQALGGFGNDIAKAGLANAELKRRIEQEKIRNQQEQDRINLERERLQVYKQERDPEYVAKYEKAIATAKAQGDFEATRNILTAIDHDEKQGTISPETATILRRRVDPTSGSTTYRPAMGLDILSADPGAKDQSGNPINPFSGWVHDKFNNYYLPVSLPSAQDNQMQMMKAEYDKLIGEGMEPAQARVEARNRYGKYVVDKAQAQLAAVQLGNDIKRRKIQDAPEVMAIRRETLRIRQSQAQLGRDAFVARLDQQDGRMRQALDKFARTNYPGQNDDYYKRYVEEAMNNPELNEAKMIKDSVAAGGNPSPTTQPSRVQPKQVSDPLGILK